MPSITRRRTAQVGRPTTAEADILAATERLLAGGATFTELGVQQICTEAGVARSTFYTHFRDKIELVMRLGSDFMAAAFELTTTWQPPEGADAMAEVFRAVVKIYRQHARVRQAIAEVAAYDATVRAFWTEGIDRFTENTIIVLRTEQDAGRTLARIDPVSATRVIVIGGEQAIADHVLTADPSRDDAFARELAEIWWYGVYRRPAD
jgi:AcrR family transcriptional regulator